MEAQFFQALFGDAPEGSRILIWLLKGKRSYWCMDWDEAATYADQCSQLDVYVGVGLADRDYGSRRRCRADEISAIVGLWADIDIAGPAHSKPNLPPDEAAAEQLLLSAGLAPTITIHSGHGLQAWWLFREPWGLEDTSEREQAARLAARWTATLRARARKHGWDVDATGDLSRVLRVPGTTNTKIPGELRTVQVQSFEDDRRYNPSDFDEWLIDDDAPGWTTQNRDGIVVALDEAASPPFGKFEALGDVEPRFLKSWKRERRDLQDQSASAYDQSLASFAAAAAWTDQEICDLLVAHRRKHGDDLKRLDYYQRTIAVARGDRDRERSFDAIEEIANGPERPEDEMERRTALLVEISKLIGVELRHLVKHAMDPPKYRLETTRGSIELGEVRGLIAQEQFRAKLAAAGGHYLPEFKKARWAILAQQLLDVCEESSSGEEATDPGKARAWVELYLAAKRPMDDCETAAKTRWPYVKDGAIYIFATDIRKWINIELMDSLSTGEMSIVLKTAGYTPDKAHFHNTKGRRTTADVWRIRDDFPLNEKESIREFERDLASRDLYTKTG